MKKYIYSFSLLILLIFYSKVLFSQHNLRDSILSEFESKNYSNCIEIISENIDSIKRYYVVGAIEFWTLNLWAGNFDSLVIKNYILPLKTHKMDSLSLILYGETKKNKEQLIRQIEISNLNSSAKTANLIFLDFLCLESEKDILEFKKNLKDSINIIKKNLTEFSDSVYYQIYDIDYKYSGALFSLSASTYLYQNYLYNRRPPFSLGLNLNGYRGIFLTEFQFDLIFRNYLIDERLRTNIGVNFGVGLYVFCTRKTKISAIGFLEKVNTILNNNPYYGIKINLKIETPIAIHNSLEFIGIAKRSLNLFASYAPEPNLIKIGVAYGIGYDSWQKRIRGY